jgi:hypothetical protein
MELFNIVLQMSISPWIKISILFHPWQEEIAPCRSRFRLRIQRLIASLKKELPSHLAMTDSIANFCPIYLSLLGDANDEFSLILSMSCIATQIANIPFAGDKAQCTDSQMNDWDQPNSACCMSADEYIADESPSTFNICNDLLSEPCLM